MAENIADAARLRSGLPIELFVGNAVQHGEQGFGAAGVNVEDHRSFARGHISPEGVAKFASYKPAKRNMRVQHSPICFNSPSTSSIVSTIKSASLPVMHIGGLMRKTLPNRPPLPMS